MTAIGIQEVGTELPKLIGRIRAGEPVLLTDGGMPVAMVVAPPPQPAAPSLEEVRRILARTTETGAEAVYAEREER